MDGTLVSAERSGPLSPEESPSDGNHKDGLEGVGEVGVVSNYSSCDWLSSNHRWGSESRGDHNW